MALWGSGLDELSKALFGATAPPQGAMRMNGRAVSPTSPRQALRSGVFLMPGDRRHEGLTLTESTVFNVTLANLGKASAFTGLLKRGSNTRSSADLAKRVGLDPPLLSIPVGNFSGGNQQKIVIAKGLFAEADVYIFVEPTVGVDIGARAKLYGLMRDLANEAAVIVMSTDCDEVFGIADRFVALYKGAQVPLDPLGDIEARIADGGNHGRDASMTETAFRTSKLTRLRHPRRDSGRRHRDLFGH